ncbi:MAG: hypothetical protein SFT90_07980, partial [Rickettsiales bacterium]|nr:hypothetical protein [Rickettsiales bacterium]
EQLNKLPESLKNENINSYYLRFPDKNISNQINKFIGDFSKLKNLSEEQAKNFYEKDCKEMLTNWDINENNYNPIVGNLFKITNPEKDGFSRY